MSQKRYVAAFLVVLFTTNTMSQALAIDLSQGLSGANVGEVGGAVAGGVGGNYLAKKGKLGKTGLLAATIGGTIAGGMLGGALGKQLDTASRTRAEQAQLTAVSTGTRQTWQSPSRVGAGTRNWNNGASGGGNYNANYKTPSQHSPATGSIEPGHPYQTAGGICRDYTHSIQIDGRAETARGIACRNPDGTWRYAN